MQLRDRKSTTSSRAAIVVIAVFVLAAFAFWAGCGSSSTTNHTTPPPAKHSFVVSDSNNNRVLIYNSPFSTDESASVVLGQADFTSNVTATTATGMIHPTATAVDSAGNLYVTDTGNNRVLQFKPPFTNGMSASLAIGQPDLVTGAFNLAQNGFADPIGLAFDGSGNLWVADESNSRVLQFKPPFATGMNASLVIGWPNFTTTGPCTGTSTGLCGPGYLSFDTGGNLWVADTHYDRVLEFQPPFATGMAASLVIGQTNFSSDTNATTASGLFQPYGIAVDSAGNLWVGDSFNDRVLQFKPPFSTGMSASLVLGEPDFVTSACATTQSGICTEDGWLTLAFDSSGNLWISDNDNSRTLQFMPPFSTNQNATLVLGQPNFTSAAGATTATSQSYPCGVTAF